MTVSMALTLIGSDDEPRWVTDIRLGSSSAASWNRCCEQGHHTPEAATGHGSELAAALLNRYVRALQPPMAGALAIRKLEATA